MLRWLSPFKPLSTSLSFVKILARSLPSFKFISSFKMFPSIKIMPLLRLPILYVVISLHNLLGSLELTILISQISDLHVQLLHLFSQLIQSFLFRIVVWNLVQIALRKSCCCTKIHGMVQNFRILQISGKTSWWL